MSWAAALCLALALPAGAFERIAPPLTALPTPHGLIFEAATLAPMRHADGRECWTLHLEYAARLWDGTSTEEQKQRVATQLQSDIDRVFGETRRAVAAITDSGLLPEVGAVIVSVDEPGGRPGPLSHPYGDFTERTYYIGGGCR